MILVMSYRGKLCPSTTRTFSKLWGCERRTESRWWKRRYSSSLTLIACRLLNLCPPPRTFRAEVLFVGRNLETKHFKRLSGLNVNLLLLSDYRKCDEEQGFSTQNSLIAEATDLPGYYERAIEMLVRKMDEFDPRGSGLVLVSLVILEVRINKNNHLRGSSYVELHKCIREKKYFISIKSSDDEYFRWTVLSALHPVDKDSQRVV